MNRFLSFFAAFILFTVAPVAGFEPDKAAKGKLDFARDVRPILQANCFSCHGKEKQEGGLRLDKGTLALKGGESGKVIIPGTPDKSRLLKVLTGDDEDAGRMPPEGEGRPLTPEEIERIRKWIAAGANWPASADVDVAKTHWAFQPIQRPIPPNVKQKQWVISPIDRFVLAQLESRGIKPAAAATKATLIRRVHLDLLGLPPGVDDIERYLADHQPGAYERMVERALASPHYGERWGRHWLDLARYADSDGYEKDRPRPFAWRYRDWVIDALNQDMPFDQFSISQIAGDMLPASTLASQVAAGFHRNTLHNTEGGTDQEEDRFKKTVDRTNTVSTIWLGLTVGCAQCHTHKYDPITHREYYQIFAFFNNINERNISAPTVLESAMYRAKKVAFDATHKPLVAALKNYEKNSLPAAIARWEASLKSTKPTWTTSKVIESKSAHGATFEVAKDQAILVKGTNKTSDVYTIRVAQELPALGAVRLEALPHKTLVKNGPGRANNGNFVLAEFRASIRRGSESIALTFKSAKSDFAQNQWPVSSALTKSTPNGWAVSPQIGKRHVAVFTLGEPVSLQKGDEIAIELDQTYKGETHNLGHFRLSLSPETTSKLEDKIPDNILKIVGTKPDARDEKMKQALTAFARSEDSGWKKLKAAVDAHAKQAPKAPGTSAQSVVEVAKPRETKIHIRGEYLRKGDLVNAGVPDFLPKLESSKAPNRLDFAQWIFAQDNPLAARVTANRVWHRLFGRGLVATVDDFGTQGDTPTHPELLDWLASCLVDGNWSLKKLQREILLSAVYRQSSALRPKLAELDPDNELLARHPRRRVESEIVRDLALAASGLLERKLAGPSVRPKQPAEYSALTYANSAKWKVSAGSDQYRRGLYTFFQRTSPYPMLMTFDSPDSNTCTARRSLSNTPLQALTLWNDPVFFEAAQQLGKRVVAFLNGQEGQIETGVRFLFLSALSRPPSKTESETMVRLYKAQLELASTDAEAAKAVAGSHGTSASDGEVAAWVMLARTILNLDEFITKE